MLGETVLPRDNSTVARFPLDDKTGLLVPDSSNTTLASAVWAWEINIHNVQGLVFANENYWITENDGDDVNSDIYRWSPGSWADEHLGILPAGVQGIAYKPAGEELWMVGSVPGKRYVMAISTTMKNLTRLTDGDQGQSSGEPKTTEVATPPAQGRGLGPGGITGVVIGVLAGLAAVTGTGFLVLRRQRKDNGGTEVMSEDKWLKPELGPGVKKGAELPGQLERERQEMAAGEMAVELPLSPSRKGADHAWPQ